MSKYNLAQVNIAKVLAPMDDFIMKGFVDNLYAIYQIADTHQGFVSRINNEEYTTELRDTFPDESFIVNISVWKDLVALSGFTYKSGHIEIFKRKKEWFNKIQMKYMGCWYIPEGHVPTHQEAKHRLNYVNKHICTPYPFSFKDKFSIAASLNYKPLLL